MADESQVTLLKRSVKEWNEWRRAAPTSRPDLKGADLSRFAIGSDLIGVDLSFANLQHTNFWGSRLSNANLAKSNLSGANFSFADMTKASLEHADLQWVNFTNAHLESADLRGASLFGAVLHWTRLQHADVTGARFGGTALASVNLSLTKGLEHCMHRVPSSLDQFTLRHSGNLPLAFLRGCGLPDRIIEYLPSILKEPLQFYSVFISFSTGDQAFADRLHADLQNHGVRCWFAPHDILPGKKLYEQFDEAIRVYDRLLLILSESSMSSEWVKTEIANARQKELRQGRQVLFPISLAPFDKVREWKCFDADTGKDSAREIREYFIPDFSNWKNHDAYKATFETLMKGLKAEEQETTGPD